MVTSKNLQKLALFRTFWLIFGRNFTFIWPGHGCCRMKWHELNMAILPYGLWWRKHRRLFHEYFRPATISKFQPIQKQETQAFLRRLLVTPDNFFHHI